MIATQNLKAVQNDHEKQYLDLLQKILENGNVRRDRTGTGTLSIFAPNPLQFDISQTVPLLTTKRMDWKGIIKELLWFIRGDTDAKILRKQGVRIWDGNTSREFLDQRGLPYDEGILGPGYGWQMRHFGAKYDEKYADSSKCDFKGGFDQIAYVENLLKTDPFSRRIYMNYWNAKDLDKMALTPCHVSCQFYVEEKEGQKLLSSHVYIRSQDFFLGNPYNIFSYTVLTYILAKKCGMFPNRITISFGDVHIYMDHVEQVKEQLMRSPKYPPKLILSESLFTKDYPEISINDFNVIDYDYLPPIKARMSV